MPFDSKKQQGYFHWLKGQGKLPKSIDLDEYDKSTDYSSLPSEAHMAEGGEVGEYDDHDPMDEDLRNGENPESGEPDDGYAFGGMIKPHMPQAQQMKMRMGHMAKGGMVAPHKSELSFAKALRRVRG